MTAVGFVLIVAWVILVGLKAPSRVVSPLFLLGVGLVAGGVVVWLWRVMP